MGSINQNQPEQNHEDLVGPEAVTKIRDLVKAASTGFFCTEIQPGRPIPTRPMAVQEVDDNGCLWFMSANDSHQNREIARDSAVQLMFQGSSYSEFLSLYGHASVSTDKALIEKYWKPTLKTWFTEGKDDPRITVICVQPTQGYYWDTKHNKLVVLAKMVAGAVMGKTLDDSIEGTLQV